MRVRSHRRGLRTMREHVVDSTLRSAPAGIGPTFDLTFAMDGRVYVLMLTRDETLALKLYQDRYLGGQP